VSIPPSTHARLTVTGLDHRTCSDRLREQLFVADEEVPAMLSALAGAGLEEALVLSTCDRVEVLGLEPESGVSEVAVAAALSAPIGLAGADLADSLYRYRGEQAIHHVFRVASALDSQVVGEPQVLGQVKAAHRLAKECGGVGPVIDGVLRGAYEAAKEIRSATRIGEGAVSLATAAIARMRDLHGEFEGRTALLVGPGELGVLIAGQLVGQGLERVIVVDRFRRRAAATAAEIDPDRAEAATGGLDALGEHLAKADIAITALGEGRRLVVSELAERILRARRRRPIFFLDLSIPGEVDPAVHRLDDAYVYDIDDLEHMTRETRAAREAEAHRAEQMVAAAVERFVKSEAGRDAAPDIRRLRDHVQAEVRAALDELGVADADRLAHRVAGRLSHAPSIALRRLAEAGRLDRRTRALIDEFLGLSDDGRSDLTED